MVVHGVTSEAGEAGELPGRGQPAEDGVAHLREQRAHQLRRPVGGRRGGVNPLPGALVGGPRFVRSMAAIEGKSVPAAAPTPRKTATGHHARGAVSVVRMFETTSRRLFSHSRPTPMARGVSWPFVLGNRPDTAPRHARRLSACPLPGCGKTATPSSSGSWTPCARWRIRGRCRRKRPGCSGRTSA